MTNILLVTINSAGDPKTLNQVFRALEMLGKANRIQPASAVLETNVSPRGVRSFVRGMLGEHDSVCVAEAIKIIH